MRSLSTKVRHPLSTTYDGVTFDQTLKGQVHIQGESLTPLLPKPSVRSTFRTYSMWVCRSSPAGGGVRNLQSVVNNVPRSEAVTYTIGGRSFRYESLRRWCSRSRALATPPNDSSIVCKPVRIPSPSGGCVARGSKVGGDV